MTRNPMAYLDRFVWRFSCDLNWILERRVVFWDIFLNDRNFEDMTETSWCNQIAYFQIARCDRWNFFPSLENSAVSIVRLVIQFKVAYFHFAVDFVKVQPPWYRSCPAGKKKQTTLRITAVLHIQHSVRYSHVANPVFRFAMTLINALLQPAIVQHKSGTQPKVEVLGFFSRGSVCISLKISIISRILSVIWIFAWIPSARSGVLYVPSRWDMKWTEIIHCTFVDKGMILVDLLFHEIFVLCRLCENNSSIAVGFWSRNDPDMNMGLE